MKIFLVDKQGYINATFEEVMKILMKNGESKLTCLNAIK